MYNKCHSMYFKINKMVIVNSYKYFVSLVIILTLALVGCDEYLDPEEQAEVDEEKIKEYIEENDLDAERHSSGLYYVIEKQGSGSHPKSDSYVKIERLGYFLDDEIFAPKAVVELHVENQIEGLQIGIPLFKRGGEGILLIPSALGPGVGHNPYGGSSNNKVMVYEIELIDFN